MQNETRCLLFCCWLIASACNTSYNSTYSPLNKMPAVALQQDVQLLQNILEANHPSLYWYTPKDSMDLYFNRSRSSIKDSLNELEFKNHLAELVSHIKCGHTTVRFSGTYRRKAAQFQFPAFPLAIKTWGDSLVVLAGSDPKKEVSRRGTIIQSINGKTNKELLDSIFQYISVDGYANNYKSQLVSNQFGPWYKTIYGLDSQYVIRFIDSLGVSKMDTLKNYSPSPRPKNLMESTDTMMKHLVRPTRRELKKQSKINQRSLQIDTTMHTAYMRITSFSTSGLKTFFRKSFNTIREQNITHLVIDLRENGGGQIVNSIRLTKYLAKHPFKVADTVVAISRNFKYGRYINQSGLYWFPMNFNAHKLEDGKIHYRRYENNYFTPYSNKRFDGEVFIIQGGLSFSAATMFTANLKGQSNVKIVGEESGGGYYGNSAVHIPTIVLPNSKLRISLPMYRVVLNKDRPKGFGITPDILVSPSSAAIRKGVDLKMQTIRNHILAANQINQNNTIK